MLTALITLQTGELMGMPCEEFLFNPEHGLKIGGELDGWTFDIDDMRSFRVYNAAGGAVHSHIIDRRAFAPEDHLESSGECLEPRPALESNQVICRVHSGLIIPPISRPVAAPTKRIALNDRWITTTADRWSITQIRSVAKADPRKVYIYRAGLYESTEPLKHIPDGVDLVDGLVITYTEPDT